MRGILNDFGCCLEEKKPVIVTDRSSNMIAAFRDNRHIHCMNHLIHNCVEKAVKDVQEIADLVINCSKLVKYFEKSGSNSNLGISLKSTIFYLYKSVEVNWVEITNILIEKNQTPRIEGKKSFELSCPCTFSFRRSLKKKLEGSNYPTIHLTIPYLRKLQKCCTADTNNNACIAHLKSDLSDQLLIIIHPYISNYHKIVFFLFPPTNKLVQCSATEKLEIIEACKKNYYEKIFGSLCKFPF